MRFEEVARPLYCLVALALVLVSAPLVCAQQVQNGNMEGGFTNGVANQWMSWKEYAYEGTFMDGTDYYSSPSHSQKYAMGPPGRMAIYQVVNTAADETYTFSLDLRTWYGGTEEYSGQHLNVFMGLDPTGGTNIHSVDVVWYELSNARNTWVYESRQVTAECCWTTIYIKANDKWDTGHGAAVWIDDVAVSGPTADPTWTYTPTVTPTNTPPIPVGSELITNGGFEYDEGDFPNGVASYWTAWDTVGDGYWKPSTLVGPAGAGNYGSTTGWVEDVEAMHPKTIQFGCGYGWVDVWGNDPDFEDTLMVGGQGLGDRLGEVYGDGWQEVAEWLADKYEVEAGYHPRMDAWTGMNEPDWQGDQNWQRAIDFEMYFTELMHQRGMKTVVMNISTGSPGDIDRILWCKDLFEVADYLGYHCYGGPTDQMMIKPYIEEWNQNDPYDFALRARRYHRMYRDRGWTYPATIYTEGTTYFGYKAISWIDNDDMRDDICWFIPYMEEDRWCIGLQIFVVGCGCGWCDWDITDEGIADDIGATNMANPSDKTDGLYSQMFGVGTVHCHGNVCDHDGVFTGGIVQQVSGLSVGETYRLGFDFKWEYRGGDPSPSFQYGLDWTGQTSNGSAGTISWSPNLISLYNLPHEIFQYHYDMFEAQASTVSVWLKGHQNVANVSLQLSVDAVSLQQVSGEPPPTQPPAPTATATPTPEAGQGLLNGDMEGGFTSGVANEWTSYCTNGSPTFSDGTDRKHGGSHSQKIVYPNPSGAGHAGIYQVVSCSSSQNGTLTGWKNDHLSGSDPWALVCRLGYDLSGGTNPEAGSVVWAEFDCTPHDTWITKQVQFTTTGSSVTVFVEAWHKGWNGTHTAWLDDVTLEGVGGGPGPTVTPVPATPTPAEGGGLLNGDMESGFSNGVANEWSGYCTNGSPTFSDGTDRKHGGAHSQKIVYPNPSGQGFAGIYQVVGCSPSQNGTLTAWKNDHLSGSDPWALVCRLGYDLSGGTNPQGGSVVWAEFNCTPHDTWISKQVQFTTTGNSVTVFVEAWHKGWGGTHTAWLDDIDLDGVGGSPPATTPTPTPPEGCGRSGENLGSLTNMSFQNSWSYQPVPQDPPGWIVLQWGTNAGPQYYTGSELANGRPSDHRCKYEMGGSTGEEHVLAKEVNWGSATEVDVSVWCAGRKWDGSSNGTMSLGVDLDGCGINWSEDVDVVVNRTSNNETWSQLSLTNLSKPGSATAFTIMLRANRSGTNWNCQFDAVSAVDSSP